MKTGQKAGEIEVIIKKELCKGCGLCEFVCPKGLIKISTTEINRRGFPVAIFEDREGVCTGCAQCAIICPDVVIEIQRV